MNTKEDILKNMGNQTVDIDFHNRKKIIKILGYKSMATVNSMVTNILLCSTEERNSCRFETT